jgi:Icc-related predicted phosphoesterase
MRILAFSDLHCDVQAATAIAQRAGQFDWLIGAGDFATMRRGLEKTIDVLRQVDRPTFLVPGNGESFEELRSACRGWSAAHVLHGTGVEIDGLQVFGIGGGIPVTPFGSWSFDFSEEQAAELLQACQPQGVLISHSPPWGAVDATSAGKHVGSSAVRAVVEKLQPRLVICGHIHDCWEQRETIGSTLVVNAGPRGVQLDLPTDAAASTG